jgi:uncharacterized BrkB/YihY/UPF0761 family membrane protein
MFVYFFAPVPWRELFRRTIVDSNEDGIAGLAAQLAFYFFFFLALFPALLFLVSLLAYLPVEPAIGELLGRLERLLPRDALEIVRRETTKLLQGDREGLLTFSAIATWAGLGGTFEDVWRIAQWPVAFALVVVGVDLVYHFAPNARTRWVWITPGSLLATALWLAASLGFKLYLRYVSDIAVV